MYVYLHAFMYMLIRTLKIFKDTCMYLHIIYIYILYIFTYYIYLNTINILYMYINRCNIKVQATHTYVTVGGR